MNPRQSQLPEACYSRRLDDALGLAADSFRTRIRKGSTIPYVTHLLQVMVTVGEHGGDEDQMIAALLHDYLEDIEGAEASALEARFGERVARFVLALSDSTTAQKEKRPWQLRKEAYVALLANESAELKLISSADKLHNASSILRDYRRIGEPVWERFTASRDQTLWYYRSVVAALGADWEHPILDDLRAVVITLHREVGAEAMLFESEGEA